MYKQNCLECALGETCSAQSRSECLEYLVQHDMDNDEILDEYIQKRREEFYREWFAYTKENYE